MTSVAVPIDEQTVTPGTPGGRRPAFWERLAVAGVFVFLALPLDLRIGVFQINTVALPAILFCFMYATSQVARGSLGLDDVGTKPSLRLLVGGLLTGAWLLGAAIAHGTPALRASAVASAGLLAFLGTAIMVRPDLKIYAAKIAQRFAFGLAAVSVIEIFTRSPAFFAIGRYLGSDWTQDAEARGGARAFYLSPNVAAQVALLTVVFLLTTAEESKKRTWAVQACALTTLVTLSRATLAAGVLAMVVLTFSRRRDLSGTIRLLGLALLLTLGLGLLTNYGIDVTRRVTNLSISDDATGRSLNSDIAQELLSDRPLLGIGDGEFRDRSRVTGTTSTLGDPHNLFYLLGLSGGVLPMLGLAGLYVAAVRRSLRAYRREAMRDKAVVAFVLLMVLFICQWSYASAGFQPVLPYAGFVFGAVWTSLGSPLRERLAS